MQGNLWRPLTIATLCVGILPLGAAHAQGIVASVYYHDQSGTILNGMNPTAAVHLAATRLGFPVRLPASWPRGTALRTLWVMDRHSPRFVVLYYGDGGGYITCQLHQSLNGTAATMSWAPQTPFMIGHIQGVKLESNIGGAHPVVELIWRWRGVRYDLLGSSTITLSTLMAMATSLP